MKKLILIALLSIFSLNLLCQTDRIITRRDTVVFKTDIEKVQYCLGEYYHERETGLILTMLGTSIAIVSSIAIVNNEQARKGGIIAGSVIGIVGLGITIDSDKWIKRSSISISPGKLTLNF